MAKFETGGHGDDQENGQDWAKMAKDAIDERTREELGEDSDETVDMPGDEWEEAAEIPGLESWREQLYQLRGFMGYEQSADAENQEKLKELEKFQHDERVRALREMRGGMGEDGKRREIVFPRQKDESPAEYSARLLAEAKKKSSLITPAELADMVKNRSQKGFYDNLVKNTPKNPDESPEDYAARISYLAEVSRRREADPNKAGEDDSSWRARIGLADMQTWVKQEKSRETAHAILEGMDEAVKAKRAEIFGDDAPETPEEIEAAHKEEISKKLHEMMPKMLGEKPEAYEARLANALAQVRSMEELTFDADDIRNSEGAKRQKYNELRKVTEKYPQLDGESLQQYRDRLLYLTLEDGGIDLAAIDAAAEDGDNPEGGHEGEDDSEKLKEARDAAKERAKTDKEFGDWLELLGITDDDIDNMSIDEINGMFGDFEKRDTDEGKEKAKAIVLTELEKKLEDEKFRKWLEDQGINPDDLKGKSAEDIRDVLNKFEADQADAESKEKRKELMDKFSGMLKSDKGFSDFLAEKGINTQDQLKDLSPEEMQSLMDEYEQAKSAEEKEKLKELMDKFSGMLKSDKGFSDFLAEKGINTQDQLKGLSPEEMQALIDEYEQIKQRPEMKNVAVVELDVEKDVQDSIRALANEKHVEYLQGIEGYDEQGNPIVKIGCARRFMRRVLFGSMLKEANIVYYEKQIRKEYAKGKRKLDKSGIERFAMAYAREAEDTLIHNKAGEDYSAYSVKTDEEGKEYVERRFLGEDGKMKTERIADDSVMAKNTRALRDAIRDYASGEIDEKTLESRIANIRRKERDDNGDRVYSIENYVEAAKAARENLNHGYAMENVMEGFAYIDGKARRNVRTQEHRDAVGKITRALTSNRVGRFISPEIVAGGAGIATYLTQRTAVAIGGIAATGLVAGFKENGRVTRERAIAQRRIAQGGEIGETKFDRQIGETIQTMFSAEEQTKGLTSVLESLEGADLSDDDRKLGVQRLLYGLARTEALVGISDNDGIDMLQYESGENAKIEDQRLRMDIARAEARKVLRENGITDEAIDNQTSKMMDRYYHGFEGVGPDHKEAYVGLDVKERAFRKFRAKRVATKTVASVVTAAVTAIGAQELRAAISDDLHGVFDHLTGHKDSEGASKTVLANIFKMDQQPETISTQIANGVDEAAASQFRGKEGYRVVESGTREVPGQEQVSASEFVSENGKSISRVWYNNNTEAYDGNELGIHADEHGFFTNMFGSSTHGSESMSFDGGNDITGYLTLNKGEAPIEIAGTIVDGQVSFADGLEKLGLSDVASSGRYAFFEVGRNMGENADGSQIVNILATATGHGFGEGSITTDVVNEVPIFDVIKDTTVAGTGDMALPGLAFVPLRRGLTFGDRKKPASENPGNGGNGGGPRLGGSPEKPKPTGEQESNGGGAVTATVEKPNSGTENPGSAESWRPTFNPDEAARIQREDARETNEYFRRAGLGDARLVQPNIPSVFETNSAITSENSTGKMGDLVRAVDSDKVYDYVRSYFNNGYINHGHLDQMVSEFRRAVTAWDALPADKRLRVLKGEDADDVLGTGWDYWTTQFERMGLMKIDSLDGEGESVVNGDAAETGETGQRESASSDAEGTTTAETGGSAEQQGTVSGGDFYRYMGLSEPISKNDRDLTLRLRQGAPAGGNWSNTGLDNAVHKYAYDHGVKDKKERIRYGTQLRDGINDWMNMSDEDRRATINGTKAVSENVKFLQDIGLIKIG